MDISWVNEKCVFSSQQESQGWVAARTDQRGRRSILQLQVVSTIFSLSRCLHVELIGLFLQLDGFVIAMVSGLSNTSWKLMEMRWVHMKPGKRRIIAILNKYTYIIYPDPWFWFLKQCWPLMSKISRMDQNVTKEQPLSLSLIWVLCFSNILDFGLQASQYCYPGRVISPGNFLVLILKRNSIVHCSYAVCTPEHYL